MLPDPGWGMPNPSGAIVTAGGLVVVGASMDPSFRALEVESGKLLAERAARRRAGHADDLQNGQQALGCHRGRQRQARHQAGRLCRRIRAAASQ